MRSPFQFFRKYQKTGMAFLAVMAMFAFVVFDASSASQVGGGEWPTSMIALALGTALAIVFWFAGRQGGKGTEYAIAGGLIGVAIAVIVPLVRGVTPVVKTDVFDWSNDDLQKAIQQRQLANNFLNAASMKIGQAYMDAHKNDKDPPSQFQIPRVDENYFFNYGKPSLQQDVVFGYLLQQEAKELGIEVDDAGVLRYIEEATQKKLTQSQFQEIRRELGIGESQLAKALANEIKGRLAVQMLLPRATPTPEQFWDIYRRLHVREQLDLAAIPVSAFEAEIPDPSQADVTAFFEKYKQFYPQPGSTQPAFGQPQRVRMAYLEANYKAFEELVASVNPVTDADVETYYNEHKENFRTNQIPDFGDESKTDGPKLDGGNATDAAPSGESTETPAGDAPQDDAKPAETPAPSGDAPSSETQPPAEPAAPTEDKPGASIQRQDNAFASVNDEGALLAQAETTPPAETPSLGAGTPPREPATAPGPNDPNPSLGARAPLPEFQPLDDDLKGTIRDILVRTRTRQLIAERIEKADAFMLEAGRTYQQAASALRKQRAEADPDKAPQEVAPADLPEVVASLEQELKAFAEQNNLKYVETPLLSAEELLDSKDHPLGQATEPVSDAAERESARSVLEVLFGNTSDQVYRPFTAEDITTSDRYAYWKIEDKPAHVPTLDEPGVRDQVIAAWKRSQAQPKAEERAQTLLELAKKNEGDLAKAFADQTVNGKPDGAQLTIASTESFSWLTTPTNAQFNLFNMPMPQLTEISAVERAGETFMKTVFNDLSPGEVGVAPNADRTVYYVVQVKNRLPATSAGEDALKQGFMSEQFFNFMTPYPRMLQAEQQRLGFEWSQQLERKYNVQWAQPADAEQTGRT